MSRRRGLLQAILELELDSVYRSPICEAIVAVILFVSLSGGISQGKTSVLMDIGPEMSWNTPEMINKYLGFLDRFVAAYAAVLTETLSIVVLLVPILIGMSVARAFEDGTLRTLLTYPIHRSSILSIKLGTALLLTAVPATLASLFAVYIYVPGTWSLIPLLLLTFGFWLLILLVSSIALLYCVLTRRFLVGTAGGIITGYGILTATAVSGFPQTLGYVLNPLVAVTEFLSGGILVPQSLCTAVGLTIAMSIALLILSSMVFGRMEV